MIPVIQGKTIDLKIIDESDIEELRVWRNSKDVADFMLSKTVISEEQQKKWYEKIKDDPSGIYWIILSKDGLKLGLACITKIDRTLQTAEPGLYIGIKKYRNSFFGMEANYYLLDYAFRNLEMKKIFGWVLVNNPVALKMNISFGFVIESVIKNNNTFDMTEQDIYNISLEKEAFYDSKMATFFAKK